MPNYLFRIDKKTRTLTPIHFSITYAVKYARKHPSYKRNMDIAWSERGLICPNCGVMPPMTIHHIIPLWVFAIRFYEERGWENEQRTVIEAETHDYSKWNDVDNLIVVCPECHEAMEKEAYTKFGREFFESGKYITSRDQYFEHQEQRGITTRFVR